MKERFKVKKTSLIIRILISVGIIISVIIFEYFGIFQVIDNYIFDIAYMHDNVVDLPISIIAIDEDTLENTEKGGLGDYKYWDRNYYAQLLETICREDSEPAMVVFDVVFSGPKSSEGDKRFADICEKYGKCILGIRLDFDESVVTEENGAKRLDTAKIVTVGTLYPELEAINPIKAFTNNTMVFDKYVRTFIPCFTKEEYTGDCLSYAAYKLYCQQNGLDYVDFRAKDQPKQVRFSYSGGAGNIEHPSFVDVINGEIDYRAFKNRIVFVGGYSNGFMDDFYAPSDHNHTMYGVEIHANILEALYDGAYQTDADHTMMGVIYGILAGIIFFIMCFFPLQIDAIILVLVVIGNLLIGKSLYDNGTVINQFSFLMASILSYIGMVIHHYLRARAAKNKISSAFKMYVAPQIVEEVAGQGDFVLNLGGRNKDIAVLFIDIRGFTTMSENLSPEEVVNILNEYFAVVTAAVFKNKGTIDKFIGDACMAVFNSPFDLDDYVFRAVHTGWDILQSGQQLQNTLMEKYGRTINFGIGVNCGEAVIGNIGCEFRMDYTAIGDTVNTSSRLESNAKAGQLLISEEVLRRLEGRISVEEIGAIPLKGKSKHIMVYNVIGIKEEEVEG
ncbi:MAG: adenylate/guanylate cyclase domain-containing protein [Lachnospiraceae bacterium]|nr:adenylate/guanylate cyclase domain-containing protein [Lachnospiraceae bacterium]